MPKRHSAPPDDANAPADPHPTRDSGTPETRDKRIRGVTTPPIDRYFQRGEITQRQHRAGIRLYTHFHLAGLFPSSTPTTAFATPSARTAGDPSFTEKQVEHRQLWRNALESVVSRTGKIIVLNVCCYGFFLRDLELSYYKSPTQLMPPLKEALDDVANYFDIPAR
jgi:hypothetical protein